MQLAVGRRIPAAKSAPFEMMKKEFGIFLLLIVLCAATSFENHRFLSRPTWSTPRDVIGLFGIFSIGLGLVIITGGIDLSVGSMIALSGMLLVMALTAMALALAARGCVRAWRCRWRSDGARSLITRFKLQPFIVTLCALLLYRGIARYIAHDTTLGFGDCAGFETLRDWPMEACLACR